jgi:uncharacterized protein with FMN-binding domain
MKMFLKVIGIIAIILILVIGGLGFYLTRNQTPIKNLKLNQLDLSSLKDGQYSGKYNAGRFSNEVKVSIQENKITKIDVIKAVSFEIKDLTKNLFDEVVKKQNTDVDIVSGATVTSKAYLKSIENALTK